MIRKQINFRLGLYPFTLEFKTREENKGYDGRTWHNERKITVADDLDEISTTITIRHEIVHALLATQGRVFQKKFDIEEMCEFIAYKLPEINEVMGYIENSLWER